MVCSFSSMVMISGICECPLLFQLLNILQHELLIILPLLSLVTVLQSRASTSTYQQLHSHSCSSSFAWGALECLSYRGLRAVHTWTHLLAGKVTWHQSQSQSRPRSFPIQVMPFTTCYQSYVRDAVEGSQNRAVSPNSIDHRNSIVITFHVAVSVRCYCCSRHYLLCSHQTYHTDWVLYSFSFITS